MVSIAGLPYRTDEYPQSIRVQVSFLLHGGPPAPQAPTALYAGRFPDKTGTPEPPARWRQPNMNDRKNREVRTRAANATWCRIMLEHEFTLFETDIGQCAIAWGAGGVVGVQLPERSVNATRARMLRRFPGAQEAPPPPAIRHAIDDIAALLRGEARNLSAIALDMDRVPPFHQLVYAVARAIPPGTTLSYGEIAARLGDRSVARDVGEAMGQNPFPLIVPCHRVVAAGGRVGGFSAAGGITTKLRLLDIEGAQVGETPTLFESLPLAARPRRG
jgi:methylated-DNA-[protein]-cysteine S-methyltransferase